MGCANDKRVSLPFRQLDMRGVRSLVLRDWRTSSMPVRCYRFLRASATPRDGATIALPFHGIFMVWHGLYCRFTTFHGLRWIVAPLHGIFMDWCGLWRRFTAFSWVGDGLWCRCMAIYVRWCVRWRCYRPVWGLSHGEGGVDEVD